MNNRAFPGGVWSATPTPLDEGQRLDVASVERLVARHIEIGAAGLMLAGTCGEGPWLRTDDKRALIRATVGASAGRLRIAVQVTDNSALRVLANIEEAAAAGAELAVVDAPYFFLNGTAQRKLAHYREIARRSCLPMGFYDRGANSVNSLPEEHLAELLSEPNIAMVKDSSRTETRREIYLSARSARPGLVLLDGDEFDCVSYLKAGYDGLLLGGGIFNGILAGRMIAAVAAGHLAEADRLQARMNDLMLRVYGGPKIECWLAGLKELLVRMTIFKTHVNTLGYSLTPGCAAQINAAIDGSDGLGYREDLFVPRSK